MAEKQVTEARVKELIAGGIKILLIDVDKLIGERIAQAIAGLAKKEEVTGDLHKIVDNFKNFVLVEELDKHLSALITKDQWNEALEGMLSTAVPLTGIRPELALAETQTDPIPPEYLTGLVFRSSRLKKTDDGKANIPTERPLAPSDVLNWKDDGDTVTIITADGQKHTVDKE